MVFNTWSFLSRNVANDARIYWRYINRLQKSLRTGVGNILYFLLARCCSWIRCLWWIPVCVCRRAALFYDPVGISILLFKFAGFSLQGTPRLYILNLIILSVAPFIAASKPNFLRALILQYRHTNYKKLCTNKFFSQLPTRRLPLQVNIFSFFLSVLFTFSDALSTTLRSAAFSTRNECTSSVYDEAIRKNIWLASSH